MHASYDNTCQPLSHTPGFTEVIESGKSPGKKWRSVKSPWSKDSCCIPVHWSHQSTGARRWAECHWSGARDKERQRKRRGVGWWLSSLISEIGLKLILCISCWGSSSLFHEGGLCWMQTQDLLLHAASVRSLITGCPCTVSQSGCLGLLTAEKRMLWLECCGEQWWKLLPALRCTSTVLQTKGLLPVTWLQRCWKWN